MSPESLVVATSPAGTELPGILNPSAKIAFEAIDDVSGIGKYEATLDGGEVFTPVSGSTLPKLKPGEHTLIIKAFDKAGNMRQSTSTFTIEGIDPPVVVSLKSLVGILDPVCFAGNSGPNDTIFINIDKKGADNFTVKSATSKNILAKGLPPANFDQTSWQYCYKKLVLPGSHAFTFSRTDANGAESSVTKPLFVRIETATLRIGKLIVPMKIVLIVSLIFLIFAILLILYLARKLHKLLKNSHEKLKNSSYFTSRIEKQIEKEIPDHNLTKEEVAVIKVKIKNDLLKAEKEFDKNISDNK